LEVKLSNFFRKVPTTAVPIMLPEILRAALRSIEGKGIERFEKSLSEWLSVPEVVLVNKGTSAIYLILKALRELHPERDEVIYPAYTVPTLKLAFDRAGLKTRVCDIKRETFNLDPESLAGEVNSRTLAVIPVHMFGFPMELKEVFEVAGDGVAVIEDACQAPGASIGKRLVGSIAPSSIFSLCKGKNISTYGGGFAAFKDLKLAGMVRKEWEALPQAKAGLKMLIMLAAYSLAMRSGVYGPLYFIIKRFKSEELHQHLQVERFTGMQAELGEILLRRLEVFNSQRRASGMYLYEAFKEVEHILIPRIVRGSEPVFNHFPVVFLNDNDRQRAQTNLWQAGIDTARMYLRPNHHIYDLGYPRDAFPNSRLVAQGLVTLPTHPFVTIRDLEIMIDVIRGKSWK
jgi:dTDP-4-amino-4,6-dideoxygalactose transaminase